MPGAGSHGRVQVQHLGMRVGCFRRDIQVTGFQLSHDFLRDQCCNLHCLSRFGCFSGTAVGSKFCLLHKLPAWLCPLNELTFSSTEVTFFIPGNTCWSEISFIWYRDSSFLLLGVLTAQLSLSFYFEPICDFVFVSVFLWGDCLSIPRLIEQNTTNWAAYKHRTFISPNWRLDVQNQSDGRFHVWWGPASWFIDSIFLLCPHLEEAGSLLYKDILYKDLYKVLIRPLYKTPL